MRVNRWFGLMVLVDCAILVAHFMLREWLGFFDLDIEQNAASIWTGITLWLAATAAMISAYVMVQSAHARRQVVMLALTGLSFLYIGLDDMTMFHERLGFVLNNILGLGGYYGESFNWLLYYTPLIIVALLVYYSTYVLFRHNHRRSSSFFLWGVLLWIGSLVIEYGGGRLLLEQTINTPLYQFMIVGEEALELFGATLLAGAFFSFTSFLIQTHVRITHPTKAL